MSEPTTRFLVGRREGGERLDQFLHRRIPGLSRTRIQRTIRERVTVSWEVAARPSTPVRAGGEVLIGWIPLAEERLEIEIPVIARGAGWIAVDKPAGLAVHPVNRIRENTVIRMLRRQEGREGLRLVHRLDRETSGVLLVAEDHASSSFLSRAFVQGEVGKEYLAMVAGSPAAEEGTIDLPIGDVERSVVYTRREAGTGQPAVTDWRVEQRFGSGDRTLLRVFPRTGRRHQIRVHLAALGHPILGDILYGRPDRDYLDLVSGKRDARVEEGGPRRQLLHCARLSFPTTEGTRADVTAALPPDFALAPDR